MTWFLAQLKPNSYRIAERNLERQGFSTYLPLYKRTKPSRGSFQTTLEPLFPGYIFVAYDPAERDGHSINATFGVTRLVSFGDAAAVVPDELITRLMQRFDNAGCSQLQNELKAGDTVQFTSGPFADLVTKIEAITPDQRVWVLLDLMGRRTRVAAEAINLRPA